MRTIEWQGESYRIADKIGLAPLIRFAKVAKQGADANDLDGLVAMHDLLEQCFTEKSYCSACESTDAERLVAPEPADGEPDLRCCPQRYTVESEFDRWMDAATVARADQDEILEVVALVIAALSERPTGQPSDSPAGQQSTKPSTEVVSVSGRVQERLEAQGRPDLALVVLQSQERAATG